MAFTPQEEQQLRELLNNTTPLKDQPILDVASEATTAILGAVHDNTSQGRLRKLGIAILHQALQVANPFNLELESVEILARTSANAIVSSNVFSEYDLDIKEGITRHSFEDNYYSFTFILSNPSGTSLESFYFSKNEIDLTSNTVSVSKPRPNSTFRFRKLSNTSFELMRTANYSMPGLIKIIGHKINLELETT